jgi:hypothetical protein
MRQPSEGGGEGLGEIRAVLVLEQQDLGTGGVGLASARHRLVPHARRAFAATEALRDPLQADSDPGGERAAPRVGEKA